MDGSGDRLRIAYLSDANSYARGLIRLRALQARGAEVRLIPTSRPGSEALGYDKKPLWERAIHKLGFYPDVRGAGKALVELARSQPLDLIWADKSLAVRREAFAAAKQASGASAVAFSEDDMALSHNQTRRWLNALDQYDLVVTTKIANIEHRELEALGARRVLYVTQTFDESRHFPVSMEPAEYATYAADLGFVGWYEQERAQSILALAEAGLTTRIWGWGWTGKLAHPHARIEGRPVVNTGEKLDYSKALTASKIGLGFLRKLNRDQHTSRSLEIPACGSMLLAERTPVHQQMFEEGVEAEFFADDAELIAKARYYLQNENKRLQIARAGRARCLRDHSSARQMALILQDLQKA